MSNLPYDPNQQPSIFQNVNRGIEASQNMKFRAALGIADVGIKGFSAANVPKIDKLANVQQIEKVKKALEETNKQLTTTQKLTETGFGKFGRNVKELNSGELSRTSTLLDDISKKIGKAWEPGDNAVGKFRKSLIGVEKTMEKIAGFKFGVDSVNILTNAFVQLRNEINQVNSTMKIMSKSGIDPSMIQQINEFSKALTSLDVNGVEEMATGFVAQYAQVTQSLAKLGTLVPQEIKKATSEGVDYLGSMFDNLQSMVNTSLKNTVSSIEAVEARYTALQAGIGVGSGGSINQVAIDKSVENTLKLVATQGGDANQVMELLAQTMTAFGMSANSSGEILSKLTKLVDVGITTIPELSSGFGQLGVSASSAGVTLDEMVGSLAAMTLSGSNTFSAMTSLQNVYNKLVSGSVSDRLAEMNATLDGQPVRLDASSVAAKGFVKSLEDVDRALGGSKQKWQQAFGGDQEAVRGVFGVLKQGADELDSIIKSIAATSSNYLSEAFNIKIDNDKVLQFEQALNRVSEVGIKLGKILTPLFSKGLDAIEKNADKLQYLVENYGNIIVKVVEFQLQLKVLNGVLGIAVGTVMKLAGAYLVYLTATGKIIGNVMKIAGAMAIHNKELRSSSILWDKNTSVLSKVGAVFGQLLGFYDIEKASRTGLTQAQQRQIDGQIKEKAIATAAHKEKMDQLDAQIAKYKEVEAVRNGGGTAQQRVFQDGDQAAIRLKELEKNGGIDTDEIKYEKQQLQQRIQKARDAENKNDYDTEVSRMARNTSVEQRQKEYEAKQTKKYIDDNANNKSFQRRVSRAGEASSTLYSAAGVLGGSKLGNSVNLAANIADLFDNLGNTLDGVGKKSGSLTKALQDGLGSLSKGFLNLVQAIGITKIAIGGMLAGTVALFAIAEKNAQKARELAEVAGVDTEIVTPFDALKKGIADTGKLVMEIINAATSNIKDSFAIVTEQVALMPMRVAQYVNNAIRQVATPLTLMVNTILTAIGQGDKAIDPKNIQVVNEKQFQQFAEDKTAYLAGGLNNVTDSIGGYFGDAVYGATKAPFDAVYGDMKYKRNTLGGELDQMFRQNENIGNLNRGAIFDDVKSELTVNGKTETKDVNLNSFLSQTLGKSSITNEDTSNLSTVINDTMSNLNKYIENAETKVNDITKLAGGFTNAAMNTPGLTKENKRILESYITDRTESEASGNVYEPNVKEQVLIQQMTGMSIANQDELTNLLKLQQQGKTNEEQEKRILALKQMQLQKDGEKLELAIATSVEAEKYGDKLKEQINTVKSLGAAFDNVKAFVKNLSDIGNSNNSDGRMGLLGVENQSDNLGNTVGNFARTLKTIGGGKYSAEQLIEMQNKEPDRYKALAKEAGVDFNKAGNTFGDIDKLIPSIIEGIQNNGAMGYSSNTDKASQFQNILKENVTNEFVGAGYSAEEAEKFGNALLANQKIREQIMALEQSDHEARLQRYDIEKSVYDTLKQNELTSTVAVLQKVQEQERKAAEEKVNFAKKRLDDLLKLDPKTRDQGAVDEAKNALSKAENDAYTLRLSQADEITQKRLSNIEKEKAALAAAMESEYAVNTDRLKKIQELDAQSMKLRIQNAKNNIKELEEASIPNPEAILNAEIALNQLLNDSLTKRIQDRQSLLAEETKIINAEYEKRYNDTKVGVATGTVSVSDNERIDLEFGANEEVIRKTIEAQEDIKKIIQQSGGDILLIDAELSRSRGKLVDTYVEKAMAKYDNLAQHYQNLATTENTSIMGTMNALNTKISVYDKLAQAIEQASNSTQIGSSNRDSDMSWLRENTGNKSQLADYEKSYLAAKERSLMRQIELEKQAFEIQKKQQEIQTKILEIQQKRDEIQSRSELQQAAIKEQQVLADPNSTNAQKMAATATRESAQMGYEGVLAQRPLIELQKGLNQNQNTIDEYSMRNRQMRQLEDVRLERGTVSKEAMVEIRGNRVGIDNAPRINTRSFDINRMQTDYSAESNRVVKDIMGQTANINTATQTNTPTEKLLSSQLSVQENMVGKLEEIKSVIEQLSSNPANSAFFSDFENKRKNGELGGFVTAGKLNTTEQYFMTGQIPNNGGKPTSSLPKVNTSIGGSGKYGSVPEQLMNDPRNTEFTKGVLAGKGGFAQAGKLNPTQEWLYNYSAKTKGEGFKKQQETAMAWLKNNQGTPNNPQQLAQYYKSMKENKPNNNDKTKPTEGNQITISPRINIKIDTADKKQLAEDTAKKIDAHLLALFTEAAKTI